MAFISVLMPMRNAARYVRSAVVSVLSQAGVDFELIVIDDDSTDRSPQIVRELGDRRVRLVNGPCGGISVALNRGIELARGEVVARCDADDFYPPARLARQAEFLAGNPQYAAVAGGYATVTRAGRRVAEADTGVTPGEITDELRTGATRTHIGTFAIRADALRAVGGFRPYFVTAEDVDLQLRLGESARVWYDPAVTYFHRLHDASISYSQGTEARVFYEQTARHFQAQRRAGGGDDIERNCPPLPPERLVSPPVTAAGRIQEMLLGVGWREHRLGRRWHALGTAWRAVRTRPGNVDAWRQMASMAVRRSHAEGV